MFSILIYYLHQRVEQCLQVCLLFCNSMNILSVHQIYTHSSLYITCWQIICVVFKNIIWIDDLLLYFGKHFHCLKHFRVNGQNYEKTSNGWLDYMDKNWKNGKLKPVLAEAYGEGKEYEWYTNWRLFFLACAELFGYDNGEEWIVSHYLFEKR